MNRRIPLSRSRLVGIALVTIAGVLGAGWFALRPAAALPADLRREFAASAEFVDRRGQPLRALLAERHAYVFPARFAGLPPHFVEAVLAAEDRRFFSHDGIDPAAMLRAAVHRATGTGPASGASTITQQLAKLALQREAGTRLPRDLWHKLAEVRLARRIEIEWTKTRIFEAYVSRLEYGNMRQGIAAASRHYFGKPPSDLSLAESALLAGLPNAPARLDPRRSFAAAKRRQIHILNRMLAAGWIDARARDRAAAEPLRFVPEQFGSANAAPHFVDLLLHRRGVIPPLGGEIATTIDADLNRFAAAMLGVQLEGLAGHRVGHAAAVVLHNPTGEVLAMASAAGPGAGGADAINAAWTPRSAGSALKPFAFALAIENGDFPGTVIADVPAAFNTPTGIYRPNNFRSRFHGPVSLRFALGNSLNVSSIRVLQRAGGPPALHRLLRDLGFSSLSHPHEHYGLGLVLGNADTRLVELANACATLARGGVHLPLRLLRDERGGHAGGQRIFSESTAWLIADMLADPGARAAAFGLDSPLRLPFPAACKTGTSSNYRDNVAVGFTPEFTVAVWAGNLDGSPMLEVTGVTGAAPAMRELLIHLHETRGTSDFKRPPDIREVWIDPLTGRGLPAGHPHAQREFCVAPPVDAAPGDYDAHGRVRLGAEYGAWLETVHTLAGARIAPEPAPGGFRIAFPADGSTIELDPDLPQSAQRIVPRVEGAQDPRSVRWHCATLPPPDADGRVRLLPGSHLLRASDSTGGHYAEVLVHVVGL